MGFQHNFSAPGVGVSHFVPGGGKFALLKNSTGFAWGDGQAWNLLIFTDTLGLTLCSTGGAVANKTCLKRCMAVIMGSF